MPSPQWNSLTASSDGEYRATTADGVVIGIRNVDNDPKGELSFWSRALENRMREAYGLEGIPLVIDFVPRKRDR